MLHVIDMQVHMQNSLCHRTGGIDMYVTYPVHIFQYCHYVAGLVGIGLSHLFSASQLEDESLGQDDELANSMGLFLQKTNIIRDYLEDVNQGREFWPHEVQCLCH